MKKLLLALALSVTLAFPSMSLAGEILIDDGKGRGFKAEVNSDHELVTRAIIEKDLQKASGKGNAFSWTTGAINLAINDTFIFLQNTGDDELHLDTLVISGDTSATATRFDIGLGSDTTTPAGGTLITGRSINQIFSANSPDAIARSGETAVADATVINTIGALTDTMIIVDLVGMILGKNHYIQINTETEPTLNAATIIGHYE